MRHALFLLFIALYILTLGQNYAYYTSSVMVYVWFKHDGKLGARL